jgi:urease accessory protein
MSDWLTWQVVDSAFPTGSFAHSWGLESAWQHGEVDGPAALRQFLEASVHQAGYAALPLVNAAFDAPEKLELLDDLAEVFLINVVANRASRVQGRTLAATAARVWPTPGLERLEIRVQATYAHGAPVSGAVFKTLGLSRESTQRVVLYGVAKGVLSAAVRLGIVGSYEAQRIQQTCGPWLDRVAAECADLSAADLAQTAPLIDMLQGGHDRLYSRLFQS